MNVKRIYIKQICALIVMFILLSHAAIVFEHFLPLAIFFSAARYLCFICVAVVYLKQPKFSWFEGLWLIFFVWLLLTTILGRGVVAHVIGSAIDLSILMMMFNIYRDDLQILLKAILVVLSFYIYLNFLLLIKYPLGIWIDPISLNGYYLLSGNYNGMGARFICAMTTNLILIRYNKNVFYRFNFILLIVISFGSALIVGSMTTLASMLILLILWMCAKSKQHKKVVIAFFILYIVVQIVVVFTLSDLSNSKLVVYIVQNIMHKNLTFTSRSFLWANSADLIAQSPFLGYGFQDKVWNALHMNGPGAHNFVYTILLYGGFPLLILFISIIIYSIRRAYHSGETDNVLSYIFMGTNVLFFMMIFEYYTFFLIAYMILLINFYPEIRRNGIENG